MEYVLILILQIIGCSLHVLQKVKELDKKFPDDTLAEVFDTFLKSDRITLIISGVIALGNLVAHYIVATYYPESVNWIVTVPVVGWQVPYIIAGFITALALGYFGQVLFYALFGKAEKVLMNKIDNLK